jgi:hypothetical protein
MMGWVFAIVITAIVGSFAQDLFLPKFLRRAEDPPKKGEPEATERSILAMVFDDMVSLDLIKAQPRDPRPSLPRQLTVGLAYTGPRKPDSARGVGQNPMARRPAA